MDFSTFYGYPNPAGTRKKQTKKHNDDVGLVCDYIVSEKNTLNPIDCHLKKGYPILIIVGTIIFGATGHQMTVQYSTSPNVCFCTTWGKQNQRNTSLNEQKYVKKASPTLSIVI